MLEFHWKIRKQGWFAILWENGSLQLPSPPLAPPPPPGLAVSQAGTEGHIWACVCNLCMSTHRQNWHPSVFKAVCLVCWNLCQLSSSDRRRLPSCLASSQTNTPWHTLRAYSGLMQTEMHGIYYGALQNCFPSPRSRCQQGWFLLRVVRENQFCAPLPAFGSLLATTRMPWLIEAARHLSLYLHLAFSPVRLSPNFPL